MKPFAILLRKELRAGWILALLAFLAQAWIAVSLAYDAGLPFLAQLDLFSPEQAGRAFRRPIFASYPGSVALALGLALGLVQTLGETVQGTTSTLIHLAGTRRVVVSSKILAALALMAAAFLPAAVGVPAVAARHHLELRHLAYLWVGLAGGAVLYLGTLATLLRGHRQGWRGHARQSAIAVFVLAGVAGAAASPWFPVAVLALSATGAYSLALAYTGFLTREF